MASNLIGLFRGFVNFHSFVRSFIHSFIHPSVQPVLWLLISSVCSGVSLIFIHSFVRSFIHSFIRPSVQPVLWLLISSVCSGVSLIFIHSFVRSFIHSFVLQYNPFRVAANLTGLAWQYESCSRPGRSSLDRHIHLGVVPQSDLSSTIIVSRCYNHLNFILRLTACSTKRPDLTVIVG